MSSIDIKKTKAILIGVSEFRDKCFINASPIKNNVTKIKELLQDKDILGIDEKKILVLDKNERHDEILNRIEDFLEQDFDDTVIFYFAGHGYKTDKGDFYLVTNNSNKKHLNISAIPWDTIKGIFEKGGSGIQQRFYILDTCHSGSAELGDSYEVLDIEDGSALIAAAKADSKAYFNETDQFTYFTDALINILENGIQNFEEPELAIRPIFNQLDRILKERKIEVTIKSTHKIDNVTLFKNKGFDKAEINLKKAKTYFDQGNYTDAINFYKEAISEYVLAGTVGKNKKKINGIKKEIVNAELHLKIQEKFLLDADKRLDEKKIEQHFHEPKGEIDQLIETTEKASREKPIEKTYKNKTVETTDRETGIEHQESKLLDYPTKKKPAISRRSLFLLIAGVVLISVIIIFYSRNKTVPQEEAISPRSAQQDDINLQPGQTEQQLPNNRPSQKPVSETEYLDTQQFYIISPTVQQEEAISPRSAQQDDINLQPGQTEQQLPNNRPGQEPVSESKYADPPITAPETTDNQPLPATVDGDDEIFFIVEDMPGFMGGGQDEFRQYISENLRYPQTAAENGIAGSVFVQFVVKADGSVADARIVRGIDPFLDREAIRVVMSSPKWDPGRQRGEPVSVALIIPINFVLE